jgi:hypothetical protein
MYTSGPKPQRRSLNELAMLFQRNLNREVNAENGRVEGSRSLCWSKARYHWLRSMVMRDKLFAVVFKISGRSAAWLARLVRDQEVGGSNPLAPTTCFRVQRFTPHENAKSAWLETEHSCLMPVGRKRSLFFEFIALQRKFRSTGNRILGKCGLGPVCSPGTIARNARKSRTLMRLS